MVCTLLADHLLAPALFADRHLEPKIQTVDRLIVLVRIQIKITDRNKGLKRTF